MTDKQPIHTDDAPAPRGAYSQAVLVGEVLYTAGMGPIDPATGAVVGDDVAAQTRQVMANLSAALGAAGLTLDHVVKATVHLADLHRDFAAFNETYGGYFTPPYPVRTTVGSTLHGFLVEIDFVAHR